MVIKCAICEEEIKPEYIKEKKYIAEEVVLIGPIRRYICVDCPRCGCQVRVQPVIKRIDASIEPIKNNFMMVGSEAVGENMVDGLASGVEKR